MRPDSPSRDVCPFPYTRPAQGEMAGSVIFLRPLSLQEGLSLPIVSLLFPISPHRVAAVVPDHGRRMESQCPALLLQPPAHIDIVAGNVELRIKSPYGFEGGLAKRHVTARNVLRLMVREQHVDWATGRVGNTLGDRAVASGGEVWPTNSRVSRTHERGSKVGKPVGIRVGIVVNIGDDFACGRF